MKKLGATPGRLLLVAALAAGLIYIARNSVGRDRARRAGRNPGSRAEETRPSRDAGR